MLTHDLVYLIFEKLNLQNKKPVIIQWWGGGERERGREREREPTSNWNNSDKHKCREIRKMSAFG